MKALVLLIFTFGLSTSYSQQFNRPIPEHLFPYEFSGQFPDGHYCAAPFKLNLTPQDPNYLAPYLAIFDRDGFLAWYMEPGYANNSDFKYHSQSGVFTYVSFNSGVKTHYILDQNFQLIDSIVNQTEEFDMHDLHRAQNGNWLVATRPYDTMDLSSYTFDGQQGDVSTNVRGFGVQEIDANGTIVFEWNSNDHIHPSETYDNYGYNSNDFDYCHGNSIHEASDGHILISMRHLNAIYKIHRTTGAILWQLGGVSSSFSFPNDIGFSGQHDARELANGQLSLYDNGNMSATPRKSRALIYDLDTNNWTATLVEEHIHPDQNYHRAMGNHNVLNDGSNVVGWGFTMQPKANASAFDAQGNMLGEYHFMDSVMSYRFIHFASSFIQRPEITCQDLGGGNIELIAPLSSTYQWSTGETTQSIIVNTTDTYQVWIPLGEGFVGSIPFEIFSLQNPCTAGIDEIVSEGGNYQLFDLMGKKIEQAKSNHLYLKVWDSGLVEKILYTQP